MGMIPHPQGQRNIQLASGSRGTKEQDSLTNDKADLTMGVLIATGHHGSHCVIDNGNNIQLHRLHTRG